VGAGDVVEGVAGRAVDLGHAAEAVGVLDRAQSRWDSRTALPARRRLRFRAEAACPGWGGRRGCGVEGDVGALERVEGQGADDVRAAGEAKSSATARPPTAVMSWVR